MTMTHDSIKKTKKTLTYPWSPLVFTAKVITKVAAGKNDHIVLFHNVLLVAANRILPLSHFKIRQM